MTTSIIASSAEQSPARAWASHALNAQEKALLARAHQVAPCDPYEQPAAFRDFATVVYESLSEHTRAWVVALAAGTSARPELYISNLPEVPDLPPTPTGGPWTRSTDGCASELLMVVFSVGLGWPTSYKDQRDGSVFHDIYPTRNNAKNVSSQSHAVSLGLHSEMFFHPEPPDFLALHCLRPDPDGVALTGVAAVDDFIPMLSWAQRATLSEPLFAFDLATLHGSYNYGGQPITTTDPRPCIPVFGTDGRFRFEPGLVTPTNVRARAAMDAAEEAAEHATIFGGVGSGGMLLLDNRRAAHSRTTFPARYDGTDRWLRRMMITTTRPFDGDALARSNNLDLRSAWRARRAVFADVAYSKNGGH